MTLHKHSLVHEITLVHRYVDSHKYPKTKIIFFLLLINGKQNTFKFKEPHAVQKQTHKPYSNGSSFMGGEFSPVRTRNVREDSKNLFTLVILILCKCDPMYVWLTAWNTHCVKPLRACKYYKSRSKHSVLFQGIVPNCLHCLNQEARKQRHSSDATTRIQTH